MSAFSRIPTFQLRARVHVACHPLQAPAVLPAHVPPLLHHDDVRTRAACRVSAEALHLLTGCAGRSLHRAIRRGLSSANAAPACPASIPDCRCRYYILTVGAPSGDLWYTVFANSLIHLAMCVTPPVGPRVLFIADCYIAHSVRHGCCLLLALCPCGVWPRPTVSRVLHIMCTAQLASAWVSLPPLAAPRAAPPSPPATPVSLLQVRLLPSPVGRLLAPVRDGTCRRFLAGNQCRRPTSTPLASASGLVPCFTPFVRSSILPFLPAAGARG